MKRELIKVCVPVTVGKVKSTRVVEGHRVTLPGFEAFVFVMHRAIRVHSKWSITEASTGLALMLDKRTQAEALETLRDRFERGGMTPAGLQKGIDAQLRRAARTERRMI